MQSTKTNYLAQALTLEQLNALYRGLTRQFHLDPVASYKMREILDEYAWFYNEAALNVLDTVWGKTITGLEQVLGGKKLNGYAKPVEEACSLKNLTRESETCPNENSVENYDPQNRLKFWEWWLTEAIPEAWERAKNRPIGS